MNITEEAINISSRFLNREVTVSILKPEGAQSGPGLHLLILNDGQELHNLSLPQTVAELFSRQKLPPLIVAAIHAGEDRIQEYGTASTPDFKGRGAKAEAYTRFVIDELLPTMLDHAGVSAFSSTAIAGCSLGGLSALDIAWHHPEHFEKAGVFSGSFWWRSKDSKKSQQNDQYRIMHRIVRNTGNRPPIKCWFEAGTRDESSDRNRNGIIDAVDDTVDLIRELEEKGYRRPDDIVYREVVGGTHHPETWGKAMPHFLSWAFGN